MREDDFTYFNRRAGEELVAAVSARSVEAARIHRDLAERMRRRAEEFKPAKVTEQAVEAA